MYSNNMKKLVYLAMFGFSAMFIPFKQGHPVVNRDLTDKPFHTRIAPKDGTIVEFIPKKISKIPASNQRGVCKTYAMDVRSVARDALFRIR